MLPIRDTIEIPMEIDALEVHPKNHAKQKYFARFAPNEMAFNSGGRYNDGAHQRSRSSNHCTTR